MKTKKISIPCAPQDGGAPLAARRNSTLYLPAAGIRSDTDGQLYPGYQTVYAHYWEFEAYSPDPRYARNMGSHSTGAGPDLARWVYYAFSLRCIKK